MNTTQKWLGALLLLFFTGGGVVLGVQATTADTGKRASHADRARPGRDVAQVNNPLYDKECGSCHFAYQPGWLPERSWDKIMTGLKDHFGENAELAADPQRQLTDWLRTQAAEGTQGGQASRMVRSIRADESPLRITDIPYFRHEHRKLPARAWKENPKVRSLSRCETCHVQAAAGSFDEHEVRIPDFGVWKD